LKYSVLEECRGKLKLCTPITSSVRIFAELCLSVGRLQFSALKLISPCHHWGYKTIHAQYIRAFKLRWWLVLNHEILCTAIIDWSIDWCLFFCPRYQLTNSDVQCSMSDLRDRNGFVSTVLQPLHALADDFPLRPSLLGNLVPHQVIDILTIHISGPYLVQFSYGMQSKCTWAVGTHYCD